MAEAIRMGRMTDTMEEGFVAELSIKVGDTIKSGDTIAEIETDKATLPLESYFNGTVLHVSAKKGDSLKIGDLIAIIGKPGENFDALLSAAPAAPQSEKPAQEEKKPEAEVKSAPVAEMVSSSASGSRIKASPLAKSIAKEKGIDLTQVKGSGEEGRIVKRDIEQAGTGTTVATPAIQGKEGFTDVKVSQMRKTIAKRLSQSKMNLPHFYLTVDINMNKAVALRTDLNAILPTKVSFNDLVIKAVAKALRENPGVNSSWLGDTIRTYNHVHIGMAVAVDEGLVVPVIKFADQKSISEIGAEARQWAEKAKNKKLLPADMEGSTFTISNLGMFGIDDFTAIINEPNACILAVGGIRQVPVVENGEIKPGNMMKVTLSSDHRVVDGAVGAKFLQSLKALLEAPLLMFV
ncbi:MAG: dihydrolipoamide acetyltransferase family protein [Chitinophagales bacterium]